MNSVKRILGVVWILCAIVVAYYGLTLFGIPKIMSDKQDDIVFGIIILFVLLPIIVGGLLIFGKYALQGEYDDEKLI